MNFLIISQAYHYIQDNQLYSYGPYVKEINLWIKHTDKINVIAPKTKKHKKVFDQHYSLKDFNYTSVPTFNVLDFKEIINSVFVIPYVFSKVFLAMRKSDHIHLRCPGNMGLIGALAQIFFPKKPKTAKYAGNWDWESKQPWSYRMQQRILRNTFLTRNMTVLVYGDWNETKNIKPFFTASYSEKEIIATPPRILNSDKSICLIYVGGLQEGKRPILGLEVLLALILKGISVQIHFYGEGPERPKMEKYIDDNQLHNYVFLHGNVEAEIIKDALQKSHFLIFISKSEGWPKVVAESMFWGCLPLTSAVSCVPDMIGYGTRGELIEPNVVLIVEKILYLKDNPMVYKDKCQSAMIWSRKFTLEKFEDEVGNLLK